MNFLYLSPHLMVGLNGTGGGPVANATYNIQWITDGLPGRPVAAGATSATWTAAGTAHPITLVTLISSNVDIGATVVMTTGTTPAVLSGGRVPLNPFKYNAAGGSGGTISVAVSGNSVPVIAGMIAGGQALELERPIQPGGQRRWQRFNRQPDPQMGNIAIYRTDKYARTFNGTTTMSATGLAALQTWYDSTNDGELPSVIVPDPTLNDAWCVKFGEFGWEKQGPDLFTVSLAFVEYPRVRW